MKTKLITGLLLIGSSLFAAPRISVGIGVGIPAGPAWVAPAPAYVPAPAYAPAYAPAAQYYAPAPAYAPAYVPAAPGPGYMWVNGYWYFSGGHRVWHRGYWAPHHGAYGHYWRR